MKQQMIFKVWSTIILTGLLLALAMPGWGQVQWPPETSPTSISTDLPNTPVASPRLAQESWESLPFAEPATVQTRPPVFESSTPTPVSPGLKGECATGDEDPTDNSKIISANTWGAQVSRGDNGRYYAAASYLRTNGTNGIKVYQNMGDPAVSSWSLICTFWDDNGTLFDPDIEAVTTDDSLFVLCIDNTGGTDSYVLLYGIKLSTLNWGIWFVAGSSISYPLSHCSLTSDKLSYPTDEYLYACWRRSNDIVYSVDFKRSTDNGRNWADYATLPGGAAGDLPTGNAISYCPGDQHVHICWSDVLGDVRVSESGPDGVSPWTTPVAILASSTYNISAWSITSNYGNYILVSADAIVSAPDYDVMYAYSNNGGSSWASSFFNWPGDQKYPSCASNNDGYFSLLYYYSDGASIHTMKSALAKWTNLGVYGWSQKIVDADHYSDLPSSACVEDIPSLPPAPINSSVPDHGGVWSTGFTASASSYFGWGQDSVLNVTMIPHYAPIIIPASGDSIRYSIQVQNTAGFTQNFYIWCNGTKPNGGQTSIKFGPELHTLPAGGIYTTPDLAQWLPGGSPAGNYLWNVYAGSNSSYVTYDNVLVVKNSVGDSEPQIGGDDDWGLSEVAIQTSSAPTEFALKGSFPNPFNPSTTICYQLKASSMVSLRVYDVTGKLVATLVNGWRDAGDHEITFSGSGLASGMYLVRMQAGEFTSAQKMMLLK